MKIIILAISFLIPLAISSKEKIPFDINKYEIKKPFYIDCPEKKKCYQSCMNVPNFALLFAFRTSSIDHDISKKIQTSCLQNCSYTVCLE